MTVILLAPHLEYPLRMGMDIYAERLGRYLSNCRGEVVILGARTLTTYENGAMLRQELFENSLRTKNWSAVRTILKGSHYYVEKFLTPAYRAKAVEVISNHPDSLLMCSYIVSASLLSKRDVSRPIVILTLIDEIAWFQQQRHFYSNPLQKLTAYLSERWVRRFLREHASDFVYAHITEEDLSLIHI